MQTGSRILLPFNFTYAKCKVAFLLAQKESFDLYYIFKFHFLNKEIR